MAEPKDGNPDVDAMDRLNTEHYTEEEINLKELADDCGMIFVGNTGGMEFLGNKEEWMEFENAKEKIRNCGHTCTSDCRRKGCNCDCGEWHKEI